MRFSRNAHAAAFFFIGGAIFALGILLLLIKLVILLAWYAAGAIAVAGLALMMIGMALVLRRQPRKHEIEN